jgi:hypothetical protein
MARSPVGYRSPFNKISSVKASPLKNPAIGAFLQSGGGQALMAAAPGIISGIGSLFGRRKRRRKQAAARKEMEAAKQAYMDMKFENPLEGITNPYAGMQNPYGENLFEDLTVDTRGADYLREQQQQQQANIMASLKGVAGGSGVAGLAQSMANIGTQQAQKAAAIVSQQDQQNKRLRLKGEQARRKGSFEFDKMQRKTEFDVDVAERNAQQKYVTAMEQQRMSNLYGLGLDRLSAADKARSTARSGFIKGIGQGISGAAGTFMPGGANYGVNPFTGFGRNTATTPGFNQQENIYTGITRGGFGPISGSN